MCGSLQARFLHRQAQYCLKMVLLYCFLCHFIIYIFIIKLLLHHSLLNHSLFTTHYSPFTIHYSLLRTIHLNPICSFLYRSSAVVVLQAGIANNNSVRRYAILLSLLFSESLFAVDLDHNLFGRNHSWINRSSATGFYFIRTFIQVRQHTSRLSIPIHCLPYHTSHNHSAQMNQQVMFLHIYLLINFDKEIHPARY